jgi:hypothetical protein
MIRLAETRRELQGNEEDIVDYKRPFTAVPISHDSKDRGTH